MKARTSYGRWSDEFKVWLRQHYLEGVSSSQIAIMAHEEFGVSISRNAVIGLSHRIGARSEKIQLSKITLAGPAWSIEMMDRTDVQGVAA